ncbi:Iris-A [Operophtera brumata]|uniref:Iris-A n=1 Tax=Operophtera brumata TaxID=104452 RepID=A0A0L7KMP5_OPEBR|nr:Iris-A [Operophtera brumata]
MPWGWECKAKFVKQNPAKPAERRGREPGATPGPNQYPAPQIFCKNLPFISKHKLTPISARSKWKQANKSIRLNEVVIIHDAKLPPGKWLMGRVIELHPGSDSHIRVVTLKTKNGILKRPVTKISILPVQDHDKNDQKTDHKSTPATAKPRIKLSTLFASLLLFLSIITTSQCALNVTNFRENQHLYFDKLSNMNIIRGDWKLIGARDQRGSAEALSTVSDIWRTLYSEYSTKDTYISLSESGIKSCLVAEEGLYLCHISKPIYRIGGDKDFCQKKNAECETTIKSCENIWMESHYINNYVYFCCSQCQLRMMCRDQVTIHQLTRSGLLAIDNGCILKTDTFEIIAHDLKTSEMYTESKIRIPVIAPINHIINVSIPKEPMENVEREQKEMHDIDQQIKFMKENEVTASNISYHDIHHYALIYVVIGLGILAGSVWWCRRGRGAWSLRAPAPAAPAAPTAPATAPAPAVRPLPLPPQQVYHCVSARVNKATSPITNVVISVHK